MVDFAKLLNNKGNTSDSPRDEPKAKAESAPSPNDSKFANSAERGSLKRGLPSQSEKERHESLPRENNTYVCQLVDLTWSKGDNFTGYRALVEVKFRKNDAGAEVGRKYNLWFDWNPQYSWMADKEQIAYRAFIAACAGHRDEDIDDDAVDKLNEALNDAAEQGKLTESEPIYFQIDIWQRLSKNQKTVTERQFLPVDSGE